MSADDDKVEPIAVVGLSFGLPGGATTSDSFWKLLMERRNVSKDFPKDRLNVDQIYHPDPARRGQIPVRGGHFLEEDISRFDASFFSISPDEAALMDPQQRGLLEHTYLALENAGLPLDKVSGTKTSVYTGCFTNDWQHIQFKDGEQCSTTTALGTQPCINANRISWFFNFTGNSCNVDTACSSSLVCLDMGRTGLLSRDTDMSVVAGCNLIFSPDMMHLLCNMNMLSHTSMSYSFDHRANGYSRGEGFGVLILKRLPDALRDGNTIQAIIRSTGCNQDGNTPGLTMPSATSQEALIRHTYAKAGLSMYPTRYFEAHGTGTPVGDPLEAVALGRAFRQARAPEDPLIVGALKGNIGHLEGAAGIAGVIKAILVLQKAVIPPNANFEKVNPKIDTEHLRIKFPTKPMPWPTKGLRRASVNSFGFGGTNAHVVLDDVFHFLKTHYLVGNHNTVEDPPELSELLTVALPNGAAANGHATNGVNGMNGLYHLADAPLTPPLTPNGHVYHMMGDDANPRLLLLSASDEKGTLRQASQHALYLRDMITTRYDDPPADYLDNLVYTLNYRRTTHSWRSFVVANTINDLQSMDNRTSPAQRTVRNPALAFIFTGQGAQWAGMGRELFAYPVFARRLLDAELCLRSLGCPWGIREELLKPSSHSHINRPELSQPICTALQIALVDLLRSFGVQATAAVGHSSGEIAAAYAAGAISAESAWKIAYFRGVCASRLAMSATASKGAMMAVGLSEATARPYIDQVTSHFGTCGLAIACINSPKNVTISGDACQIDFLKELLDEDSIFARKLLVDVAYHSPHMEQVAEEYRTCLQDIRADKPSGRKAIMISSVTGIQASADEVSSADYWVANMVSPVRFVDAIQHLHAKSTRRVRRKLDLSHKHHFHINGFVELGPHSAMQGPIRDILNTLPGTKDIGYSSVLSRTVPARQSLLETMGRLACLGWSVDLSRVNYPSGKAPSSLKTLTDLPGYAFDHSKSYWHERRLGETFRTHAQNKWDLLGKPVPDWNPLEAKWRNVIRVAEMPWVEDHIINGSLVYPAAGMLVMAIEAARQLADSSRAVLGFELKDCVFQKALAIPQDADGAEVQLSLHAPQGDLESAHGWSSFRLCVYEDRRWHECCHGQVRVEYDRKTNEVDGDRGKIERLRAAKLVDDSMDRICATRLQPQKLYRCLQQSGFGFGPSFQRIVGGTFGPDNRSRTDIDLFQWPESQFPQSHIVHPTSLDSMIHASIAGYSEGGLKPVPTMIPTRLRKLWVAAEGLHAPASSGVKACNWMTSHDNRGYEFNCSVLSCDRTQVAAAFEGLRLTVVSDLDTSVGQGTETSSDRPVYYNVEYRPDPDFALGTLPIQHGSSDGKGGLSDFNRCIDSIGHKYPGLSILEIDCLGDATRSLGTRLLEILTPTGSQYESRTENPRYSQFVYSSASKEEHGKARSTLDRFSKVSYRVVDAGRDLLSQGLATEAYDVVIISHPEAAAAGVHVSSLRKLLSPSGWLVVQDADASSWWGGEEYDSIFAPNGTTTPILDVSARLAGFQQIQKQRIMVASARDPSGGLDIEKVPHVALVIDTSNSSQRTLAKALQSHIISECGHATPQGIDFSILSLEQAANAAEGDTDPRVFVILSELATPILYLLSENEYPALRTLLTRGKEILWVNPGGGEELSRPEYSIVNGVARVVRNEHEDHRFTVLQLDPKGAGSVTGMVSEQQLDVIAKILRTNHLTDDPTAEPEYVEVDGILNVPRVLQNSGLVQDLFVRSLPRQTAQLSLKDAPPLSLTIGTPGLLDTLNFIEDQKAAKPLGPGDIEIRTCAIGMNRKDYLVALGQASGIDLGTECAGIVTRAGKESDLQPGDRVVALAPMATYARCHFSAACNIPETVTFEEAVTIPAQFGTAWQVVHELARLRRGETILVHAAAGGTGQAALQVALYHGATVFATVGSKEKRKLLMDQYRIPEHRIFYSRDASFADGVLRLTKGRGVDVVINSLSGEGLVASWQCVAPFGRFVEIGNTDAMANSDLPMLQFRKNASFIGFDAALWYKEKPGEVRRGLKKLVGLFASKKFHAALPHRIYDVGEFEKVFRQMQDGETPGKMVMRLAPESLVRTTLETKPSFYLDPNATYVIAGGLGGLGRSMARWMVRRRAKNLVLLSRSGPRTDAARELIVELTSQGVRVGAPACDVTDLEAMRKVFEEDLACMPPVKGCVQGSMVLRDDFLEKMSFESYNTGAACKTMGSWNLHSVLPSGMDFFIILSSASGLIGLRGQANYNGGNTYQDALARYRVSQGEKATSLDLGAMIDDGVLAENPELLKRVLDYGVANSVSREQFFAMLDYFCDPARPLPSPAESQVAVGLGTGGQSSLAIDTTRHPIFRHLAIDTAAAASGDGTADVNYAELVGSSASIVDAGNLIADALVKRLSRSLSSMEGVEVDIYKPLHTYGVDSLLAIDIRRWITKEFKANVAVFEVVGGTTFSSLGMLVAGRTSINHPAWHV